MTEWNTDPSSSPRSLVRARIAQRLADNAIESEGKRQRLAGELADVALEATREHLSRNGPRDRLLERAKAAAMRAGMQPTADATRQLDAIVGAVLYGLAGGMPPETLQHKPSPPLTDQQRLHLAHLTRSEANTICRLADGEDPWTIDPEYGCVNPLTGYYPTLEVDLELRRRAEDSDDGDTPPDPTPARLPITDSLYRTGADTTTLAHWLRWRQDLGDGGSRLRVIRAQRFPEPQNSDPIVGIMDTVQLAEEAVRTHNLYLHQVQQEPTP